MATNSDSIEKLRSVMKQNPDLLELLTGAKQKGRPQGSKNQNTLVPGKQLEIVNEQPEDEAPTPISMTAAKKMLKQFAKPRQYSDEQKAKMLENLAKGRAKRLEALQASKQQPKTAQVKKYVIKERKPATKRVVEEEEAIEEPDEDYEILKRLEKKQKIMAKLNELQKMAKPQQNGRYSLFY